MTDQASTVLIRGWAECADPELAIQALLGPDSLLVAIEPGAAAWQVADPVAGDEPIGKARSLLMFSVDDQGAPAAISVLPGSQGCRAPSAGDEQLVTSVVLRPGCRLLLDARCWYRLDDATAQVELLLARPPGSGQSAAAP